jgi:hypothetical protein
MQLHKRNLIPGAGKALRIMSDIWQTLTHLIAVVVLIFILIMCVVDGFSPLSV